MAKRIGPSKSKNVGTREVIGHDATGKPVHVGDTVNHAKKVGFVGGWVTGELMDYKGEPATIVRYPLANRPNRFSQMIVTAVNTTPKKVQAALQAMEMEGAALVKTKQVEKEKAFLKEYPRDVKQHPSPKKLWIHYPETSGGLPSLGKRK